MNSFKGLYDIRDFNESDKNFVLATFLRGVYYGDSWFSMIPKQIFMDNYKKVAEYLVNTATIKVACLKEDPSVILGYCMLSKDLQTIHWTYVKSAWRLKGIAKTLTPTHPSVVTHLSKLGVTLLDKFTNI